MDPIDHLQRDRDGAVRRLIEFLGIPSVSAVPDRKADVRRAAEWIAGRLASAGAQTVRIDDTDGHPVVFGRAAGPAGAPVVLVYGHYDVQPADPEDLWTTPPFQPTIRDGAIYARGASDDKGQVLAHIEALDAYRQTVGGPPVTVLFVVEGEEEVGSPSLAPWLERHRDELGADVAVVSDTAMVARGQPSLTVGLRGLAYMEIAVRGPNRDLHSGQFGGAVANPANALCAMLAAMHDADGRVTIPGFYDRVRPISEAERRELAAVPFDEAGFAEAAGVAGGFGEAGFTDVERMWTRPTLDVNGIWSGWTGSGAKTVLPATAHAKVSMRLVPDQRPSEIAALFRAFVARVAPAGVSVSVTELHGADPALVDRDLPAVGAAARALADAFGRPPVFAREGGTIPVVADLRAILGLPTVLMGFGLPTDSPHAPDERFDLDNYARGAEAVVGVLRYLADAGR